MMADTPFDVSGRVILVTGSSRGVGRGIAEHLARHGATVIVHARRAEALEEVTATLETTGAPWLAVTADVRDEESVMQAVTAIDERFGRLDGVIANVGGAAMGPAASLEAERFRKQLDLNLTGAFITLKATYPLLRASTGAAIVISATAATSPTPQFSAYGAAKAATEHLARSLAAEWGPQVRVNCVSPGLIRTEGSLKSVFGGNEDLVARAGATTAFGRIGDPEDIAAACHYLLSDAAAFVSGAVLVVDGGPTEGPTQRILRALEDPR
jgi:NAD(P)-dependent dehydrogenase (short-subunit alcohol dehydrogenase family)